MSSIWDIRRSPTDVKVAGLCGGVAEHFGVDPVLVRVAWVLMALSGGIGVVLYLAGWLLVPQRGRATAAAHDLLGESARRWPKEVWVALVVTACLVLFSFTAQATFGLGPALVLAAVWYFGFSQHRPTRGPSAPTTAEPSRPGVTPAPPPPPQFVPHPGPATPFTTAAGAWRRRIEEHTHDHAVQLPVASWPPVPEPFPAYPAQPGVGAHAGATALADPEPDLDPRSAFLAQPDPVGLYDPPPDTVPAPPVRGRDRLSARRLRLLCLLVLGLALGGLGSADRAGAEIAAAVYAATALLVVGLTLLAATWLGRARGLLPLGLLLVPVVAATLVAPQLGPMPEFTTDERVYATVAELPPSGDDHPAGELRVDLSQLTPERDVTYSAHVGTGRLEVVVPADADVAVRYRVGLGVVEVDGRQVAGGVGLAGPVAPSAPVAGGPTITLDLSVDRGELAVRR